MSNFYCFKNSTRDFLMHAFLLKEKYKKSIFSVNFLSTQDLIYTHLVMLYRKQTDRPELGGWVDVFAVSV